MFNIPLLLDLQLSLFAEASLVGLSTSLERQEAWTRQLTEVFFPYSEGGITALCDFTKIWYVFFLAHSEKQSNQRQSRMEFSPSKWSKFDFFFNNVQ